MIKYIYIGFIFLLISTSAVAFYYKHSYEKSLSEIEDYKNQVIQLAKSIDMCKNNLTNVEDQNKKDSAVYNKALSQSSEFSDIFTKYSNTGNEAVNKLNNAASSTSKSSVKSGSSEVVKIVYKKSPSTSNQSDSSSELDKELTRKCNEIFFNNN